MYDRHRDSGFGAVTAVTGQSRRGRRVIRGGEVPMIIDAVG
jgi:hypothetical protein